ncbi:hypothetical protein QR680_009804 [Steinernema hermaphroditum]|uniref:Uncharacterized protein n=1 Tax=Steinernema hermaphroditum TaxID=289476 RepID=A0AA39ILP7_9BILA|nr:hypothetical protein QR680_009804 [Steinernema hermaphroditum]
MAGRLTSGIRGVQLGDNAFSKMDVEAEEERPINASIHVSPDSPRVAFVASDRLQELTPAAKLGFLHIIPHKPTAIGSKTVLVPVEDFLSEANLQFRSLIASNVSQFPLIPQFGRNFQSVTIKMVLTDCTRFEKFLLDILDSPNLKNIRVQKTNITNKVKNKLLETMKKPGIVELKLDGVKVGTEFKTLGKRKIFLGPELQLPARVVREVIEQWRETEYPELKRLECVVDKEVKVDKELRNPHTEQVGEMTEADPMLCGSADGLKFTFTVRSG